MEKIYTKGVMETYAHIGDENKKTQDNLKGNLEKFSGTVKQSLAKFDSERKDASAEIGFIMDNIKRIDTVAEEKYKIMASQDDLAVGAAEVTKKLEDLIRDTNKDLKTSIKETDTNLRSHIMHLISVEDLYGQKRDKFDTLGELISYTYESTSLMKKDIDKTIRDLNMNAERTFAEAEAGISHRVTTEIMEHVNQLKGQLLKEESVSKFRSQDLNEKLTTTDLKVTEQWDKIAEIDDLLENQQTSE